MSESRADALEDFELDRELEPHPLDATTRFL